MSHWFRSQWRGLEFTSAPNHKRPKSISSLFQFHQNRVLRIEFDLFHVVIGMAGGGQNLVSLQGSRSDGGGAHAARLVCNFQAPTHR